MLHSGQCLYLPYNNSPSCGSIFTYILSKNVEMHIKEESNVSVALLLTNDDV